MNRKISLWVLVLVVFIGMNALVLFGWTVRRATIIPEFKHSVIGSIVWTIVSYPSDLKEALYHVGILKGNDKAKVALVPQLISNDFPMLDGFKKNGVVQPGALQDKGYLLLSIWDDQRAQSVVRLLRINDQKIMHEWIPDLGWLGKFKLRELMKHPLLLDDGGLLFHPQGGGYGHKYGNLVRISICSEIVWKNWKYLFHHSNELGPDGNYWIPVIPKSTKYSTRFNRPYKDDALGQVSPAGELLLMKSITEILEMNGYRALLFGTGLYDEGPLHVNDIQPAHYSTDYWERGDLLISVRNLSTVFLYRPSIDKIIWLKTGPWMNQHDVDFVGSHQISVFGNDVIRNGTNQFIDDNARNNVYVYDLANEIVSTPYSEVMELMDVRSATGGLQEILDNGDVFIEETDRGRLLRLSAKGGIWEFVEKVNDQSLAFSSWSRYLTEGDVNEILPILQSTSCE